MATGVVVAMAVIAVPVWWAIGSSQPLPVTPGDRDGLDEATEGKSPPRPAFAEDKAPVPAPPTKGIPFDADRAMKYLQTLCDLGPRVSGSEGMRQQQALLEKHFKQFGAAVTRQEFRARQRSQREAVEMVNLIVSWKPDAPRRVLLCTHYDTRPVADQEANPRHWTRPFLSANDGTSGVAMFMELAHHMKDFSSALGVDFVFFDGEEYVFQTERTGGSDEYFFGSRYFAEQYKKTEGQRNYRYEAGVLFDLFAAPGAKYPVEGFSYAAAPKVVIQIWKVAEELNVKSFRFERGPDVQDDHLALNRVGIPTVDIIDFDYPHWHKLTDTPDKCSGEQMAQVARVVLTWVQMLR